jgi:hypothetical protein
VFHDTAKFRPVLTEVLQEAHARGLRIGLQLWAEGYPTVGPDQAIALVEDRTVVLDQMGCGVVESASQWMRHNGGDATTGCGDRARAEIVGRRTSTARRSDRSKRIDRARQRRQPRRVKLLELLPLLGCERQPGATLDNRAVTDQQVARLATRGVAEHEVAQKQRSHDWNRTRNRQAGRGHQWRS